MEMSNRSIERCGKIGVEPVYASNILNDNVATLESLFFALHLLL